MAHFHFIVNPAAGGSTCLQKFGAIESLLQAQKVEYSAVYSEYPGHAANLARQALMAGRDCVVAVGGDGTVREVAQELIHTGVPVGILPFGTGNDLIRPLNIPREPEQALSLLLRGESRPVDAAMAGSQVYLNVAGFGFDVDVLEKTKHYKTKFRGRAAYLLGVLHALIDLRTHKVWIRSGDQLLCEEVLLVAVGNGTHIGGGMMVTPKADMADGLLDVCAVRRVSRLQVLRFLAKFIKGRHLELDMVRYFQAAEVSVECEPDTSVQLDGEIIGETPLTFRLLPGALMMYTGRAAGQTLA